MRLLFTIITIMLSWQVFAQITETGTASVYADKFQGRVTTSGELFDQNKLTAAHRTLPFGTLVKVTNLENQKSCELKINDRGPFVNNRLIDISSKAAKDLGFLAKGLAKVKIEVIKLGEGTYVAPSTTVTEKKTEPKPVITVVTPTTTAPVTTTSPATIQPVTDENLEYYQITSKKLTPTGFAIQIASYQEAANLLKLCSEMESKIQSAIMIQVSENQDKKVYRLMVGPFQTRPQAEEMQKKLSSLFNGCFIVTL